MRRIVFGSRSRNSLSDSGFTTLLVSISQDFAVSSTISASTLLSDFLGDRFRFLVFGNGEPMELFSSSMSIFAEEATELVPTIGEKGEWLLGIAHVPS